MNHSVNEIENALKNKLKRGTYGLTAQHGNSHRHLHQQYFRVIFR
jgi:predicted phage-related endonuclease